MQPTAQDPPLRLGAREATLLASLVALAHAVNDGYAAFLAPLLPRIMGKLGLSVTLAATLAMTLSLAASLLQPLSGYLADRFGRRMLVAAGPLLSGVFLSLMGLAPSFPLLVILLLAGGFGSAAFHPPAASLAARVWEGKGSGVRLSIFSMGGSIGFAVGPLVAVALVSRVGLEGLWIAMVPGIVLAGVLLVLLPSPPRQGVPVRPPSPGTVLALLRGPLGIVFGVSAVGAFVQRVFMTLEPIVVAQAGRSEAVGAVHLSVYLGMQALGTLTGGALADRMDRRTLLVALTLLAFPAHILAVGLAPGSAGALVAGGAAGFLNMALLPPIIVTAQEIVPGGTGVSSGIVMGLAWAVGSVGVLGAGSLGDLLGARGAALLAMPALLLGSLLASRLRLDGGRVAGPGPGGGARGKRSGAGSGSTTHQPRG